VQSAGTILERALRTQSLQRMAEWGVILLVGGVAAALIALIVEVFAVARHTAGRRSATAFVALAQIGIAGLLLVVVNIWSYDHPLRFDWTLNQQFTFSPEIQERLNNLQGETTIVVYL